MEEKKLNINIAPDKATGVFANLALIAHTPAEFVVDFAQLMPGIEQANVVSRIVMTPDHAKKLLMALQDNVAKYEQNYGKIVGKGQKPVPGSTYPMSFGGGEA
ncbi:MAG: DUF3467 domain-containing protein [Paludibacteraceae bacterium]|jgi:hypothetical protein|nr:DUF3467 domain-containing protein [Paludibacteraceae bacterium]MBR1717088.1 DUF3467 domain-containing protein [Paludibacteraceae bacterium]